jgi:hypothetical protein
MSALILPSRFTQQPQYPAPIEKGNDLARAIAFLWNAANPSFESVTGAPVTTNNATTAISNRGKVLKSSAGQVNTEWARQFITTSDGVGTGDFTFATLANPSATGSGAVEHLFAQKNDAGGAPYCQTGLLAHYFGGGYGSGGMVFLTYGSAPVECVTTGVMDGGYHMWVCRRVGTSYRLFKDGVSIASTTATAINILQSPTRYTAIGSRGNGTTESYRDSTVMAASWNRALTDNEVVQLTSNYWSLFKAPPRFYFAPSGGGASTVTCSVGNTSATGVNAQVSRSVVCSVGATSATGVNAQVSRSFICSVGNTSATGVNSSVSFGSSTTITCTVGATSATGVNAQVSRSVVCSVGGVSATGVSAQVSRSVLCSVGATAASGVNALLNISDVCAVGNATATGINCAITLPGNQTYTCSVGATSASGVNALINKSVACAVGNAASSGISALLNIFNACSVGNANASGVNSIITGNQAVSCQVGNAQATGIKSLLSVFSGGVVSDPEYIIRQTYRTFKVSEPYRSFRINS